MRVAPAVQAHPSRTAMAEALAQQISGEVVYDPSPSDPPGPWRAFARLLEETPAWATHRLQVQDDALVCPHFREAVDLCVAARPEHLLVFFVSGHFYDQGRAVIEACERDESWARLPPSYWLPCVSTCWPVGLIPPMLEFASDHLWPLCADDELIGRWLKTQQPGLAIASVPSLVEHPDVVQSVIRRRPWETNHQPRLAACWIGDCQECDDPRTIDWTTGAP